MPITRKKSGGGGGVLDYNELTRKPITSYDVLTADLENTSEEVEIFKFTVPAGTMQNYEIIDCTMKVNIGQGNFDRTLTIKGFCGETDADANTVSESFANNNYDHAIGEVKFHFIRVDTSLYLFEGKNTDNYYYNGGWYLSAMDNMGSGDEYTNEAEMADIDFDTELTIGLKASINIGNSFYLRILMGRAVKENITNG